MYTKYKILIYMVGGEKYSGELSGSCCKHWGKSITVINSLVIVTFLLDLNTLFIINREAGCRVNYV